MEILQIMHFNHILYVQEVVTILYSNLLCKMNHYFLDMCVFGQLKIVAHVWITIPLIGVSKNIFSVLKHLKKQPIHKSLFSSIRAQYV